MPRRTENSAPELNPCREIDSTPKTSCSPCSKNRLTLYPGGSVFASNRTEPLHQRQLLLLLQHRLLLPPTPTPLPTPTLTPHQLAGSHGVPYTDNRFLDVQYDASTTPNNRQAPWTGQSCVRGGPDLTVWSRTIDLTEQNHLIQDAAQLPLQLVDINFAEVSPGRSGSNPNCLVEYRATVTIKPLIPGHESNLTGYIAEFRTAAGHLIARTDAHDGISTTLDQFNHPEDLYDKPARLLIYDQFSQDTRPTPTPEAVIPSEQKHLTFTINPQEWESYYIGPQNHGLSHWTEVRRTSPDLSSSNLQITDAKGAPWTISSIYSVEEIRRYPGPDSTKFTIYMNNNTRATADFTGYAISLTTSDPAMKGGGNWDPTDDKLPLGQARIKLVTQLGAHRSHRNTDVGHLRTIPRGLSQPTAATSEERRHRKAGTTKRVTPRSDPQGSTAKKVRGPGIRRAFYFLTPTGRDRTLRLRLPASERKRTHRRQTQSGHPGQCSGPRPRGATTGGYLNEPSPADSRNRSPQDRQTANRNSNRNLPDRGHGLLRRRTPSHRPPRQGSAEAGPDHRGRDRPTQRPPNQDGGVAGHTRRGTSNEERPAIADRALHNPYPSCNSDPISHSKTIGPRNLRQKPTNPESHTGHITNQPVLSRLAPGTPQNHCPPHSTRKHIKARRFPRPGQPTRDSP